MIPPLRWMLTACLIGTFGCGGSRAAEDLEMSPERAALAICSINGTSAEERQACVDKMANECADADLAGCAAEIQAGEDADGGTVGDACRGVTACLEENTPPENLFCSRTGPCYFSFECCGSCGRRPSFHPFGRCY